jgi:peptidoglycan/xylan/chitin deacetylase (PgdA/CDA1 family)
MPRAVKTSIEVSCAILYAGIRRLLGRGPCRVVLLYHGVGTAHLADFRKQMAYLARNCVVVKPSQILAGVGSDIKPVVALTFDDALVSVFENALPVLKEYGLPAGIFVPTGYLGRRPGWVMYGESPDDGDTVMTDQQIAALDRDGFEISSHTICHPVLSDLDDRGLEAELAGSRRRLDEIVGHRIGGISYPYGACDARVLRAAHQAGYEMGFTVEPNGVDGATDRLRIGRFEVTPCETFIQFKLKVGGAYHAAAYLRRLKAILLRSRRR